MANKITFEIVSGERCRLSMINNSDNSTCTTEYQLTVYDTDDQRWENHAVGSVTLGPGDSWSEEFHKWRANGWKHQILSNNCEEENNNNK